MFTSIESPIFQLNLRKKFLILSLKMVKKTSEFVRGRVLEMYHFLKSCRKVSKNLAQGISVCSKTVNNSHHQCQRKKDPEKILQQETEQEPWKATSTYKEPRKQSRERHRLRRPTSSAGSGEEVRSVKDHSGSYYWHGPRNEVQKETENSQVDRQTGCTTT